MTALASRASFHASQMSNFTWPEHGMLMTDYRTQTQARPPSQGSQHSYQNPTPSQTVANIQQFRQELRPLQRGTPGTPLAPHDSPQSSSDQFPRQRAPYLAPAQNSAPRQQPENISYFAAPAAPYRSAGTQGGYPTAGKSLHGWLMFGDARFVCKYTLLPSET